MSVPAMYGPTRLERFFYRLSEAWPAFRADRICALLGAAGLVIAAWLAVRYAVVATDPIPVPPPLTLPQRPAEFREAQSEAAWAQLHARLRAEAVDQNQTARAASRAETVQGCATAAGVGLTFVGLGLVISGRRIDERERDSLIKLVERRDDQSERIRQTKEATRGTGGTGGGTGGGGDLRLEPLPGVGWPDRIVRHTPGIVALVCGAALMSYAGTDPRTPARPTTTPPPPAYSPFIQTPVAPQAFSAFAAP